MNLFLVIVSDHWRLENSNCLYWIKLSLYDEFEAGSPTMQKLRAPSFAGAAFPALSRGVGALDGGGIIDKDFYKGEISIS